MLKELNETMDEELKKNKRMFHQIENVNRGRNYKKRFKQTSGA